MLDILKYFPDKMLDLTKAYDLNNLEEIRIRVNRPVIFKFTSKEIIIDYIPKQEEILKILQFICDNSIYSFQNQICAGFITIQGGHRVRNNRRCCSRRTVK